MERENDQAARAARIPLKRIVRRGDFNDVELPQLGYASYPKRSTDTFVTAAVFASCKKDGRPRTVSPQLRP
jgi:hypothetical protein